MTGIFKWMIILTLLPGLQSCAVQISPPFVFHKAPPYICFRKQCRVKTASHQMNQKRATGMGSIKSYAWHSKKNKLKKKGRPASQAVRKKVPESKSRF